MELDKALFNTLLAAYNEHGPTPETAFKSSDYADCEEAQATVSFLTTWGIIHKDIQASVGSAIQVGFEVGLQYAELTRSGVKKDG